MTEEREELKGKLLFLWLEDLKNEKEPGLYPEVKALTQVEIEELMGLARFIKGTFYPSEAIPAKIDSFAKRLAIRALEDRNKQVELNRTLAQKTENFGELIKRAINSLGIDKSSLLDFLAVPRSTFSDLEEGKMPPHRLPIDTMIKLLCALRLTFREVVDLVKKSSIDWLRTGYGVSLTQLPRIDVSLKAEEKQRAMADQADPSKELERIESYCSRLSALLT